MGAAYPAPILDPRVGWDSWIRTVEIEPAIDAADAGTLEHSVETLVRTGCKFFHLNGGTHDSWHVRDAVAQLAPVVHRFDGIIDLHVAAGEFGELAAAGADSITFDAASYFDVPAAIERVHATGVQAGAAFGNWVPEAEVAEHATSADLVLVAGEGANVVPHVFRLRELLPPTVTIQVEGGISQDNVRSLYLAGARVLIADQPIFEREDLPRAYRRLVQALA
jgi:ribulose-phosphate 3-epimerase